MSEFLITDIIDNAMYGAWLERYLSPNHFVCSYRGSPERQIFRQQGSFPANWCRTCDGYNALLGRAPSPKHVNQLHHSCCCSKNQSICEWARDEDADGMPGINSNACEGTSAALPTYLQVSRLP